LKELKPDDVEADYKNMTKVANNLSTSFENLKIPKAQAVASNMAKKLKDFRPYLPIIRGLRTEGLQSRHIEQIIALVAGSEDMKNIEE
jgi:hypothetical protein